MIRYVLGLVCLVSVWFETASAHVFYVTVTKVKWNAQQQRLDLTVRIFTTDLEQAIETQGGPKLRLWSPDQHPDRERLVGAYLISRLKFRIDGQQAPLEYTGMADALDATACFLQIRNVKAVKTIEVDNQLLIDLFEDQANVVQFEMGEEKKFVNLNKKLHRETVRF